MENRQHSVKFYGSKAFSLIPLLGFVVFCILFFVVFKTYDMLHLCMGGILSLIVGSFFSKNWSDYWACAVDGMSQRLMNELALILLVVGIFGKMMTRGQVAQGFVWLGSEIGMTGGAFVAFTFIATAIIATSTGTSLGTMFTAFPILYPSGILLGANPVLLAGAILSGAIFGDNVGPISDTTIASASTQKYKYSDGVADIAGVVGSRLKYALVAAAMATICFLIFGGGGVLGDKAVAAKLLAENSSPKGLVMLVPVAVLLTVAFKKRNIYAAVTWGLISGIAVGLVSGILKPADIMSVQDGALSGFCVDGINNMIGLVGYLYALAAIMGVMNGSGLMEDIVNALKNSSLNKTVVGSEIIIAVGTMISSIVIGSANGPAIVMYGPIANEVGETHGLHPYRRANMMDGFASTLPVVIPVTSSFIFIVLSCVQGQMEAYDFIPEITPLQIAGSPLHCYFLFVVLAFSVITGWGRRYEQKDSKAPLKEKPDYAD